MKSTGVADKKQAKEPHQDIDLKHGRARKKMAGETQGFLGYKKLSSWRQPKLYSGV